MHGTLATALVLAVGCARREQPPAPAPAPKDGLEVLALGAKPHHILGYDLAKATRSALTLEIDLDVSADGRGSPMPTMVVDSQILAEDVLPGGRVRLRATIDRVTLRDRPASVIRAEQSADAARLMEGLSLVGTLSPDGALTGMTLDGSRPLPPALASQLAALQRSFEQLAMRLPVTAVGVGARWRYRNTIQNAGMTMLDITTVTVSAIDGPRVAFTSTSELVVPAQDVEQAGVMIEVRNAHGRGSERGTIDLSRMALTGERTAELEADMTVERDTTKLVVTMVMRAMPGQGAQSAP